MKNLCLLAVVSLTFLSPLEGSDLPSGSDTDEGAVRKWISRHGAKLGRAVDSSRHLAPSTEASAVVLPDCEEDETLNTICVFRLSDAFDGDMQDAFKMYTRQAQSSRKTFMDGFDETKKWVSQQLHKAAKACDFHMHTPNEQAKECYHTHEGIVFAAADEELLEATEARLASTNEAFSDLEAVKVELANQFALDLKAKCCEIWDDDDDETSNNGGDSIDDELDDEGE